MTILKDPLVSKKIPSIIDVSYVVKLFSKLHEEKDMKNIDNQGEKQQKMIMTILNAHRYTCFEIVFSGMVKMS